MAADIEELAKRIDLVFSPWPYPGDDEVFSDGCSEVRRYLAGKRWDAVKIGHVAHSTGLDLFLTPAGYRYYLPGLMKLSLENPEIYDLPANIASALTPPTKDRRPRGTWIADYKDAFTAKQQEVIRDFLLWVNKRFEGSQSWEAAGQALSAIWGDSGARGGERG